MTALLIRHDFRPRDVPSCTSMYMDALWHLWRGWAMLAAIPLLYMRGRR